MNKHTVTVEEVFAAIEHDIVIASSWGKEGKRLRYNIKRQAFNVHSVVFENGKRINKYSMDVEDVSKAVECYNNIECE